MKAKLVSYAGAVLLLVMLSIYILTACPTVYVGDTGELVSAAFALGIPHPPGYPLFCLAGKVQTFLPAGNIAFRVNLLASLMAALGVLVFFLLSKKVFKADGPVEVFLLLLFCFGAADSFVFWKQSGIAKGALYTMTAFLLLSSTYFLEIWKESTKQKYFLIAAFLAGLSLVSHQTSVVFMPAFAAFTVFAAVKNKIPPAVLIF